MDEARQEARLTALRGEMARQGVTAFVIPRADAHQGEYVPPRDDRLAWLTGFTGSAGVAVVTREGAALFVDGRYTLQAEQETSSRLYEQCHLTETPPTVWLEKVLGGGDVLGFDPWLHTPDGIARLRTVCERVGARLRPVDGNPLDAVWDDQPPPPVAPVVPQPERFTGESAASKRARIAEALAADGVAAAVLSAPESLAWLLNVRGDDVPYAPLPLGFAIIGAEPGGPVQLFMDPAKLSAETRVHLGDGVTVAAPDAFGPALESLAGQTVRIDRMTGAVWIVERLKAAGARPEPGDDPTALPRACKSPVELAGARAAHVRDGAAMVRFLAWLEDEAPGGGLDELTVSDRLEAFRSGGEHFRGLSFPTIAGAGAHGAIVHYRVTPETTAPLRDGELFLVDSGGQYLDGTTDVTRIVLIGALPEGAAGAELCRRYTQVLKGHLALGMARFPQGTTGSQLDVLARRALWEDGVDYDHGTGHGVGSYLSVHEGPQRVSKVPSPVALQPGMILSNEPGYYKSGAYGIRIENLVVVSEAAPQPAGAERQVFDFETLTLVPYDRRLIEVALLDDRERQAVDAYHQRVCDTLMPMLAEDARAAAWLEAATAPLAG